MKKAISSCLALCVFAFPLIAAGSVGSSLACSGPLLPTGRSRLVAAEQRAFAPTRMFDNAQTVLAWTC
jgi:hypothetical protein